MVFDNFLNDLNFRFVFGGEPELFALVGDGVLHAEFFRHLDADFRARSGGDPALTFEVFPWDVVTFRANEAEDVLLAAVLAEVTQPCVPIRISIFPHEPALAVDKIILYMI